MSVIDIEQIFSIGECIGSGSFGDVFEAKDKQTGNRVALKRLKYNASLKKEAYPINLKHESIVSATSCIRATQSGIVRDFLVMEWLNGNTLKEELSRVNNVPLEDAINIFIQCAKALHYAHRINEKKIIHRDVKPSNIFICDDGTLKLTDFSIATEKDGTATADSGLAAGTYGYIAPELFYSSSNRGDEESDIFSFGVCFYETITGKNPIPELKTYTPLELLEWAKSYNEENTDFSNEVFQNNPKLRTFVTRCLARKRTQRFSLGQILKFYPTAAFGFNQPVDYDGETVKSMNEELIHHIKAGFAWVRECRYRTFSDVLEGLNELLTQVRVKNSRAVSETGKKANAQFINKCLSKASRLDHLLDRVKDCYPNYQLIQNDAAKVMSIILNKNHSNPKIVFLEDVTDSNLDDRTKILKKLTSVKQLENHLRLPQSVITDIKTNKSWAVFDPITNHTFLPDFIKNHIKQNHIIDILNVLKAILNKLKMIHSLRLYHGNLTHHSIVIFEHLNNDILIRHSTLNSCSDESLIQNQLQDIRRVAELLIVIFSPDNLSSDYLKHFRRHAHEYSDNDDITLPELDKELLLSSLPELSRILLKMLSQPKALNETINRLESLVNAKLIDKKFGNVVIGSNDHYEYLEKIVETGGHADVHKARQLSNGDSVVMKSLKDELFPQKVSKRTENASFSKRKSAIERANDESKILKSLRHKNIVKFIDVASDHNQMDVTIQRPPLLVMEYLRGMTLKNAIEDVENDYKIDVERGLRWFLGYLSAVEHCHKNGFIHRDVKPDNLFINDDDVPILLDLGIAKDNTGESTNGAIPGTPEYMAPEIIITGERGDVRTDIFSLGLCLFETLNGQSAYPWRLPESNWEKLCVKRSSWVKKKGAKWWVPKLNHPFDSGTLKIFEKMLHPDPGSRYSNVVGCRREISKNLRKLSRLKSRGNTSESFDTPITNLIPVPSRFDWTMKVLRYSFLTLTFVLGFMGVHSLRNDSDKLNQIYNYRYKLDPWYESMAMIANRNPQDSIEFLKFSLKQIKANKPNEFFIDDVLNRSEDYYQFIDSFLQNQSSGLIAEFKTVLQGTANEQQLISLAALYHRIQVITEAGLAESTRLLYLSKLGNLVYEHIVSISENIITQKGNNIQDMVDFRNTILQDFDLKSEPELRRDLDTYMFGHLKKIPFSGYNRNDFDLAWNIFENYQDISVSSITTNDIIWIESLCRKELLYLQNHYPKSLNKHDIKDDQLLFFAEISALGERLNQLPVKTGSMDRLRHDISKLFSEIIHYNSHKLIDDFNDLSLNNGIEIAAQSPNFILPKKSLEYFKGERGMSMKVSYDHKIAGMCDLIYRFDELNLEKYATLSLWVKGTVGNESFEVTVTNKNEKSDSQLISLGQAEYFLPKGITREWQEIIFPLDLVKTEHDVSQVISLNFSFNNIGKGVVYIDDLMFLSDKIGNDVIYPEAESNAVLSRGLIIRDVNPVLYPIIKRHLFSLCETAAIDTVFVLTHNPDHYFIKDSRNENLLIQFLNECKTKEISPNLFMIKEDWSSKDLHSEIHRQIRSILEFNELTRDAQKIEGLLIGLNADQSAQIAGDKAFQENLLILLKKINGLIATFPGQNFKLSFMLSREMNTDLKLLEEIISIVDYTILSDYYDNALSIINSSENCIKFANQVSKKTIIANQTGNFADGIHFFRHNTFYEEGWKSMEEQLQLVTNHYTNQNAFGGIVIDSFMSYMNLHKEKKLPQNLLRWRNSETELTRFVSYQSNQLISVDGNLKDWQHLEPAVMSTTSNLTEKESVNDTISCEYYSAWNKDYIYWAFRVFDLDLSETNVTAGVKDRDHIELWLDLQLSEDFTESVMSGDDFLLLVNPGDFDKNSPETTVSIPLMSTDLNREIKTAASKSVDGYTLEIEIPFPVLYNNKTVSMGKNRVLYSDSDEQFFNTPYNEKEANFFPEYQLGFNIVVADSDRDKKTLISSSPGFKSRNPSTFGILELNSQSQTDVSKMATAIRDQ